MVDAGRMRDHVPAKALAEAGRTPEWKALALKNLLTIKFAAPLAVPPSSEP